MIGVHRADDRLHLCGMSEYPCDGDGGLCHALALCKFAESPVEFGEIGVVDERAAEHAILQRGSRLDGDVLKSAIVQSVSIAVY